MGNWKSLSRPRSVGSGREAVDYFFLLVLFYLLISFRKLHCFVSKLCVLVAKAMLICGIFQFYCCSLRTRNSVSCSHPLKYKFASSGFQFPAALRTKFMSSWFQFTATLSRKFASRWFQFRIALRPMLTFDWFQFTAGLNNEIRVHSFDLSHSER